MKMTVGTEAKWVSNPPHPKRQPTIFLMNRKKKAVSQTESLFLSLMFKERFRGECIRSLLRPSIDVPSLDKTVVEEDLDRPAVSF